MLLRFKSVDRLLGSSEVHVHSLDSPSSTVRALSGNSLVAVNDVGVHAARIGSASTRSVCALLRVVERLHHALVSGTAFHQEVVLSHRTVAHPSSVVVEVLHEPRLVRLAHQVVLGR